MLNIRLVPQRGHLAHQLLDHVPVDDPILLARQFCDCLRDRIDHLICFIGIDFV